MSGDLVQMWDALADRHRREIGELRARHRHEMLALLQSERAVCDAHPARYAEYLRRDAAGTVHLFCPACAAQTRSMLSMERKR